MDIVNKLPEERFADVDDLLAFVSIYDDEERTRSYVSMLRRHRELIEDKVVVEAGCGLGLFSAEMARLGAALGGQPETFAGLSGIGDLVVTCTSRHSRNRGVGERLGRGESLAAIQAGMKQVAEGVWNCAIVVELARAQGIEMPICETVKAVLEARMAARDAVAMLMGRDTKHEAYGA